MRGDSIRIDPPNCSIVVQTRVYKSAHCQEGADETEYAMELGHGWPAVGRRHKFPEFGCHLGNVAKVYFGAVSVFTNRLIMLEMHQNGYIGKLSRNTFPYTFHC